MAVVVAAALVAYVVGKEFVVGFDYNAVWLTLALLLTASAGLLVSSERLRGLRPAWLWGLCIGWSACLFGRYVVNIVMRDDFVPAIANAVEKGGLLQVVIAELAYPLLYLGWVPFVALFVVLGGWNSRASSE